MLPKQPPAISTTKPFDPLKGQEDGKEEMKLSTLVKPMSKKLAKEKAIKKPPPPLQKLQLHLRNQDQEES